MRPRNHAQLDRRVGSDLGGGARHEVVAQGWCPRARPEMVPCVERARTQPAQLVARAGPEGERPEQPAGHGEIGATAAPQGAHLEALTRREREQLAARHGRTVDAHLGRRTDDRDMAGPEAAQARPAARELERAGARRVARQRVGQRERRGVGRPGSRDAHRGNAAPAAVLEHGAEARCHHLEHAPGPVGRRPGGRVRDRWRRRVTCGHQAEVDAVPQSESGVGRLVRREQRDPRPPHEVPAARRCRRVDGGVTVGQRDGAGGDRGTRPVAAWHARQRGREALEVSEAG